MFVSKSGLTSNVIEMPDNYSEWENLPKNLAQARVEASGIEGYEVGDDVLINALGIELAKVDGVTYGVVQKDRIRARI